MMAAVGQTETISAHSRKGGFACSKRTSSIARPTRAHASAIGTSRLAQQPRQCLLRTAKRWSSSDAVGHTENHPEIRIPEPSISATSGTCFRLYQKHLYRV